MSDFVSSHHLRLSGAAYCTCHDGGGGWGGGRKPFNSAATDACSCLWNAQALDVYKFMVANCEARARVLTSASQSGHLSSTSVRLQATNSMLHVCSSQERVKHFAGLHCHAQGRLTPLEACPDLPAHHVQCCFKGQHCKLPCTHCRGRHKCRITLRKVAASPAKTAYRSVKQNRGRQTGHEAHIGWKLESICSNGMGFVK